MNKLPEHFTSISEIKKNEDRFTLSIYNDKLTSKNILNNLAKIKKTFPALDEGFYDILQERLKDKGFTDKKLIDSVNHVIDNCIYPTPTIAQFLSYDRNIKLYSYAQMIKLNDDYTGKGFDYFGSVRINDYNKPMYASKTDIEKYNLIKWNTD